eukprot:16437773-Heterocapsa_arctica.AAC.1
MIILTASSGGVAAYSSAGFPGCVALSSFATILDRNGSTWAACPGHLVVHAHLAYVAHLLAPRLFDLGGVQPDVFHVVPRGRVLMSERVNATHSQTSGSDALLHHSLSDLLVDLVL